MPLITTGILTRLDRTSRRAVGRFALKLAVSLLAAYLLGGDRGFVGSVSAWLSFYALFAMVSGLLVKQSVADRSFNCWDEASWLLLAALLLASAA